MIRLLPGHVQFQHTRQALTFAIMYVHLQLPFQATKALLHPVTITIGQNVKITLLLLARLSIRPICQNITPVISINS